MSKKNWIRIGALSVLVTFESVFLSLYLYGYRLSGDFVVYPEAYQSGDYPIFYVLIFMLVVSSMMGFFALFILQNDGKLEKKIFPRMIGSLALIIVLVLISRQFY